MPWTTGVWSLVGPFNPSRGVSEGIEGAQSCEPSVAETVEMVRTWASGQHP